MTKGKRRERQAFETGNRVFRNVVETAPREPIPEENRGSWYCPTARWLHFVLVTDLMDYYDLTTFYDLGAGDFRLSVAVGRAGYNVVGYETIKHLIEAAQDAYDGFPVNARCRDYHSDYDRIQDDESLYAAIGRTNRLPDSPGYGVGIEGADELTIYLGGMENDKG